VTAFDGKSADYKTNDRATPSLGLGQTFP